MNYTDILLKFAEKNVPELFKRGQIYDEPEMGLPLDKVMAIYAAATFAYVSKHTKNAKLIDFCNSLDINKLKDSLDKTNMQTYKYKTYIV